jgi:NDP-sugar pyrophosphorylase family protein/ADP-ribose pyrophosphatase YjhB (NUDIX family)
MKPNLAAMALILAGGRGTRLLPSSSILPKPLVPIAPGISMLELIVSQLHQHSVRRIRIAIARDAPIFAYFVDRLRETFADLDIQAVEEQHELGTAGAAKLVDVQGCESLLLINADTLTDLSFSDLLGQHASSGADATVSLRRRCMPLNVGAYHLSDDADLVVGHTEKPVFEAFTSVGVTVLRSEVVHMIAEGERIDVPILIERLLHAGNKVSAYRNFEAAFDIGTPEELLDARAAFSQQPNRFVSNPSFVGFPHDAVGYGQDRIYYSGVVLRDKDGLVVLQQRLSGNSTYLTTFGGSSRMDETAVETAVREVYEETSIRVEPSELQCIGRIKVIGDDAVTYCTFYLLNLPMPASEIRVRSEGIGAVALSQADLGSADMTPTCAAAVELVGSR